MVNLTAKDWLVIIVGAIVSYFAPTIISSILSTLPAFVDWIVNNLILVVIIALIVYITKNRK